MIPADWRGPGILMRRSVIAMIIQPSRPAARRAAVGRFSSRMAASSGLGSPHCHPRHGRPKPVDRWVR